jgi:DNA replication protein DnaC
MNRTERILADLPTTLRESRFDLIDLEFDSGTTAALSKVASWTASFEPGASGIYLHSEEPGTGKTTIASAAAIVLAEAGRHVRWLSIGDMLDDLKASFGNRLKSQECVRQYMRMLDSDIVFIDDLGTERPSEFALEQLYEFVNRAYNLGLPLFVTTNLSPSDLQHRLGQNDEVAGARVVSRLIEMCKLVKGGTKDYRVEMARRRA